MVKYTKVILKSNLKIVKQNYGFFNHLVDDDYIILKETLNNDLHSANNDSQDNIECRPFLHIKQITLYFINWKQFSYAFPGAKKRNTGLEYIKGV